MADAESELLFRCYPVLTQLPQPVRVELMAALRWLRVAAGTDVFDERQQCQGFPLVVRGSIRVTKAAASGREMALYRVAPGDSCIITAGCLLGGGAYNARGVAESDTEFALVPPAQFDSLLRAEPFRRFVFGLFAERIVTLMRLVEEVAFHRLDQRLAALLVQRGPQLRVTHQQLADELGSVREIVSRLLKGFADQGLVTLHREQIDVADPDALQRVAGGGR